jgi:hypothetical protein
VFTPFKRSATTALSVAEAWRLTKGLEWNGEQLMPLDCFYFISYLFLMKVV